MSESSRAASGGAGGGIGVIGLLIILGVLGMDPCADDCRGCGPTLADVIKDAKCR